MRKSAMSLAEDLKILSILVKNQHRICMHKYSWVVAKHTTSRKEKIRLGNESSLVFCLLSDMLTKVSVIFSRSRK